MNGEHWDAFLSKGFVGIKRKPWEEVMEQFKGKDRGDYRAILDYLFMNANHTSSTMTLPGAGTIHLNRGQIFRSRKTLEKVLGLSQRRVRTLLENLEKSGILASKPTNKGLIITILNFDRYVIGEEQSDKQTVNGSSTKRQSTDNQPTINRQQTIMKIIQIRKTTANKKGLLLLFVLWDWKRRKPWKS